MEPINFGIDLPKDINFYLIGLLKTHLVVAERMRFKNSLLYIWLSKKKHENFNQIYKYKQLHSE